MLAAGLAGAVVLLGGGAALLSGDEARPGSSAAGARPTVAASSVPSSAASPPAGPATPAAVVSTARTAGEARAAVEELLAARADANLSLLRSTWAGDEDAASQAARAVAASSDGLSAAIGAWYDTATATRIRTGLDQQSEASRAYAGAVAAGDVAAADEARAQMAEVSRDLGEVLDRVTEGRIADYVPPQDAAQYRAYVDALQVDDAPAAQEATRWLQGRLAREGVALASVLPGAGPS